MLLLLLPRVYSVRSAPLNDNVNFLQFLLFCLGIVVISKRIPGKNGNHVWWLRDDGDDDDAGVCCLVMP